MLTRLRLHGVGPAPVLGPIVFGERVNLFTGDNGLGKSFLLDVAWWALTGSWPGRPAWPRPGEASGAPPVIEAEVRGKAATAAVTAHYEFAEERWVLSKGRPPMPGLVLYFRVDGRFSLWDPAQHYWRRNRAKDVDHAERPAPLQLQPDELWNAVTSADGKTICRGLIEDWVTWQQTRSAGYDALCRVLDCLSPSEAEKLVPGEPMRVWLDDVRLHPTLALPYGVTPAVLASAGMQRVLMLAYLLVWSWQGHVQASAILRQRPERRMVILFDEPETHLHPQWQRRLLPSLLGAVQAVSPDLDVQLLASTHSPLVLASMEPVMDERRDRLFVLALDGATKVVSVEQTPFVKRGDAVNWLVSDVFGLPQARSVPAELAIEAAERFMRGQAHENPEGFRTADEIHRRLLELLGDRDPFWPRWLVRTGAV